jgi:tRNA threonylcarbamoyladenosine biosynthesis protein TsaB
MILFINTSDKDRITLGLDGKMFTAEARQDKSQKLLPFLHDLLKKEKINIKDISEIKVNTGPGSFTGLRVGLSVANTIAWVLNIPINTKDIRKEGPIEPIYK